MNLLWIHADRAGCGTYRCYTPALTLQEKGFDNHFLDHTKVTSSTVDHELSGIDVAIFQRAVGTYFIEWAETCKARDIGVVFEMDDNLFSVPKHNPAAWFWAKKDVRRLLIRMLDLADVVIVSTTPLQQQLVESGVPSSKIVVCHNHLHPSTWGPETLRGSAKHDNKGMTVIGWQGSTTHDVDFREALPALRQILDERPETVLRLFGCVPLSIQGAIPEQRFQWSHGVPFDKYPATLQYMHFDIGIAPVVDSRFNQCKSNLKYLEYSALGIPCVASRVYPYAKSIRHGETGFLASTTEEWYTALRGLVDSATLRTAVGQAAQVQLWAHWGPDRHIHSWYRALALASRARHDHLSELLRGNATGRGIPAHQQVPPLPGPRPCE